MQAFGMAEVSLESSGSVTGMVTDYWNVLWPLSGSSASVSLVLLGTGPFQPSQARPPMSSFTIYFTGMYWVR